MVLNVTSGVFEKCRITFECNNSLPELCLNFSTVAP